MTRWYIHIYIQRGSEKKTRKEKQGRCTQRKDKNDQKYVNGGDV